MHLVAWSRHLDPAGIDALIMAARGRGVDLYAIAPYFARPPQRGGLILGFASMSVAGIEQAVQLLAQCVREMPGRERRGTA